MKIAWLFPGQGSQQVGMGRDVAERYASARAVFEEADRALEKPLSKLCFEGPEDELTLTVNTQPALVTTGSALVAALREAHPSLPAPSLALGHSLGEYSALVAAGGLSLGDAVRICRARGAAMQEAVPAGEGAMAAILNVDERALRSICDEASSEGVVSPANFNAPGQIVIAGAKAAVARACELVTARGGKSIPLKVSAPFHCALMKPAADKLEVALRDVSVGSLSFPVVANVDAEPNEDAGRVKGLLVKQVDAPVQWARSIERAAALGVTHAFEIGPGKVLAGLVKRIDKRIRVVNISDAASVASAAEALA
ncbi:MAG: ACP S-malonyltransferase [Polyangiaceae bacterium]|nr:ACP S-malonyltransferase [Polyangiaceae bacterium]